jgi:hypothetical protein
MTARIFNTHVIRPHQNDGIYIKFVNKIDRELCSDLWRQAASIPWTEQLASSPLLADACAAKPRRRSRSLSLGAHPLSLHDTEQRSFKFKIRHNDINVMDMDRTLDQRASTAHLSQDLNKADLNLFYSSLFFIFYLTLTLPIKTNMHLFCDVILIKS